MAAGVGLKLFQIRYSERLRRVTELAPAEVIEKNPEWAAHLEATEHIETATPEDLVWADGFVLGTPTRFGQPAAQMKQFMDTNQCRMGGRTPRGQARDPVHQ